MNIILGLTQKENLWKSWKYTRKNILIFFYEFYFQDILIISNSPPPEKKIYIYSKLTQNSFPFTNSTSSPCSWPPNVAEELKFDKLIIFSKKSLAKTEIKIFICLGRTSQMIMNPQSSSVGQRLRKRNQWFQNKYYFWKIGQKIIKYLTSIPFYGIHDLYQICVVFF